MPAYCTTALSGGTCIDNACAARHDVLRCELCGCSFRPHRLSQHQSGRKHLRRATSAATPNSGTQQPSRAQAVSANADPPAPSNPSLPSSGSAGASESADPRVAVSHEDGLDFVINGTGGSTDTVLPSVSSRVVNLEKTAAPASLSVLSVDIVSGSGTLNSEFSATLTGGTALISKGKPREILVSFQATSAGTFHALLKITFKDKRRPRNAEFHIIRKLRARVAPPGGVVGGGNASSSAVDGALVDGEGTGLTVSHESGVDFDTLNARPNVPLPVQSAELTITTSRFSPLVTFISATVRSVGNLNASSCFSAQINGVSKWIRPKETRTLSLQFVPQQEGVYEAVLELVFFDCKRQANFMVERALRGIVQGLPDDQSPPGDWADDQASLSAEEEEEEEEEDYLDSDGTGVAVSDEDGLNFGIVERTARGRFATPTMSLLVELAEGSQSVTFVAARVRTSDGGASCFIAQYEGEAEPIQPGSEATVRIMFNPRFEGRFEAVLQLLFYDSQRSGKFVIERMVHAVAGSLADHSHFEPRAQESYTRPTRSGQYVPPGNIKLLSSGRPRRRQLPDYDLPPLVQEAIEMSNVDHPYEAHESRLISDLRPNRLSMETYSQWFKALLNVEEGNQQRDILDTVPFEVTIDESHGRYGVEIKNEDEDLLPEVIVGDFLWLDDILDDIRYEARITDVDVFRRGGLAVLKMRVQLPRESSLHHGAPFMLRFRLNRITLRRQYHALASSLAPLRRLLFPSASDIKPVRQLPRSEIDNLPLVNRDIRGDAQQLQTVVSLLQHPKGSVPFIIYGPPGTGKTSTVVESMMQLLRRNAGNKILACTPSNAAADLLIERLSAAGLGAEELFRLNAYSRYQEDISEDVQAFSVPRENMDARSYRVVLSTCSSAGFLEMMNIQAGHFSHIFIDEAAQAAEPLALIPIAAFGNAQTTVVLAGDPNQLGPVIKAINVSKAGLGRSYLQRLMRIRAVYGLDAHSGQTVVDLQRNRRSHGAIIAWPNRYLYKDIIRAHATAEISRYLLESDILPKKRFPILFHGIKGSEKRTKHSPSYYNVHEASLVRDYCQQLVSDRERKIYEEDIGVIAPYKAQVRTIRELLKMARLEGITVGSVEQFQGQERKVIIIATTRSNDHVNATKALGFLRDRQRLNVAITRAQAMLIVIGDPGSLGQDRIWRTFLNYVCLCGGWRGKMLAWKLNDEVRVTGYETLPRPGGVVYGEEFIGGKSEIIYRYQGDW